METNTMVVLAGVAAIVGTYAVTGAGSGLWSWIKDRAAAAKDVLPDEKIGPKSMPVAHHFTRLRAHYGATGQPNRVDLMDSHLAAGVFASDECPADDLDGRVVMVLPSEEDDGQA